MDQRAKQVAFDFMHSHNVCKCPLSEVAAENRNMGNNSNERIECETDQLAEDLLKHFSMENVTISS